MEYEVAIDVYTVVCKINCNNIWVSIIIYTLYRKKQWSLKKSVWVFMWLRRRRIKIINNYKKRKTIIYIMWFIQEK